MEKLDFREFMGSTGVVFNAKIRPNQDWNYLGAPGLVAVSPKEDPIKHWVGLKRKKKKRKKHGE